MTIIEAIKQVMRAHGTPMTAKEAYLAIVAERLYDFHAQQPQHIVLTQIRRHCQGLDFPTAAPTKHFRLVEDNKFVPLDPPIRAKYRKPKLRPTGKERRSMQQSLNRLQDLHEQYVRALKNRIIQELRNLKWEAFEIFAKALLDVYGFIDAKVTPPSGDGGIDGHGKLKVGLAYLNVAFQCKRWRKGNIDRTEIDKFRGAIQGDYEQGIFFATTSFSDGAVKRSIKRGAVPIVLIDVNAIVNLMIEKRFGIEIATLDIPTYALDLALTPEKNGGVSRRGRGRARRRK